MMIAKKIAAQQRKYVVFLLRSGAVRFHILRMRIAMWTKGSKIKKLNRTEKRGNHPEQYDIPGRSYEYEQIKYAGHEHNLQNRRISIEKYTKPDKEVL